MIREIKRGDLNEKYFGLLSQLSGEVKAVNKDGLWTQYNSNAHHKVFVYEDMGFVVGTAAILIEHKFLHCGSHVGHIEDVVVDNEYRGKGVGEALIEHCREYATEWGCYKVILNCAADKGECYEKCGFWADSIGMRYE